MPGLSPVKPLGKHQSAVQRKPWSFSSTAGFQSSVVTSVMCDLKDTTEHTCMQAENNGRTSRLGERSMPVACPTTGCTTKISLLNGIICTPPGVMQSQPVYATRTQCAKSLGSAEAAYARVCSRLSRGSGQRTTQRLHSRSGRQ